MINALQRADVKVEFCFSKGDRAALFDLCHVVSSLVCERLVFEPFLIDDLL